MSMAKPPPPPPPTPTPTTEKPSLKNGSSSSSLCSLIRRSIAFPYGFGFAFAFLAFSIFSLLNNYYDSPISFNNRSHFSTVFSHFFFFPSSSPQLPSTRSNNNPPRENDIKGFQEEKTMMNNDGFLSNKQVKQQTKEWLDSIDHCNLYNGSWVRDDDSYPLYEAGSCPHIDEQFNCFLNGRPDNKFENFRWQPNGCNIPRLNGRELLELLRGKRLVYVGDSLNRNMWESMVCILRNSVEDKSKVFEASGKNDFRSAGSYSFIFADYNCSVEFFRSSFLVQEWEMAYTNGLKRATLRLDVMERSSDRYKSANVLIFNTGHWWTRGRTARGKGYFQEGSHIYSKLNLIEAFRKAMMTWARWIDANIDPVKTHVFFRGYSAAHFRGGQWNSGGKCDSESEPIKNATYLSEYPQKMRVLEGLMKGMKTPVFYLNITRMTDYRKDAHPSIYRKLNFTEEERRSPLRFQDCSHWCLPGVPDTWNELLYVQLLTRYIKEQQQQQQH